MKFKILIFPFFFIVIGLACSFGESNRVLNSGFEAKYGTGNVLARHWIRSTTVNSLCSSTTLSYTGTGAIFVSSSNSTQINGWISERFAVLSGETCSISLWARWSNITSSGYLSAQLKTYDLNGNGSLQGTFTLQTTGSSSGNWVQLSGNYLIPSNSGVAEIFLGLVNANPGAYVIFDDISVTHNTGSDLSNRMVNPGFEGKNNTYPSYWRRNTSITFAGWTTSRFRSSSTSVYIRQTTGNSLNREWYSAQTTSSEISYIAVDSTKTYRFGGWMRWDNVTTGNIGIRVFWMNYSDDTIGITSVSINGDNDGGNWMKLDSGPIQPPNTAVSANIRLFHFDTTSIDPIVYFDDVYFYETSESPHPLQLRLVSYNIHHCAGIDTVYNVNRIADVLAQQNPDIIGLQEVYSRYTNSDDQVEIIRSRLQTLLGGTWYSAFSANINFGAGVNYGNAILSRYPIVSSQNHYIPPQPGNEQRGCLETQINVNGTIVNVFNTHWAHNNETERLYSAESSLIWLSRVTGHKIYMGDFNARPYSQPVKKLESQLVDSLGTNGLGNINTISNPNPTVRIDHIFSPMPATFGLSYVIDYGEATVASDHRPVLSTYLGGGTLTEDFSSIHPSDWKH